MWTTLHLDPTSLAEARLVVHWASQLVAAAGASLLDARSDYSHTNLGWEHASLALTGRDLAPDRTRVALRPRDLTLLVLRGADATAQFPLDGRTLEQGRAWLRRTLADGLARDAAELKLLEHELPRHPVAGGAAFDIGGRAEALAELGRWIANAHDILERFVRDDPYASEVRLWPHHFDIASLVTVVPHRDPERAKSVNVGFSFGDETYGEPYAYVSPWPYPTSRSEAPPLTYGGWHTEGFFAAVFRGSDLLAGGGEGQAQRVERFLAQASDLSRTMLGVPLGPR
jgi:hypothetical protein